MSGNEYQTDVITGRYDASFGCFLKGNKNKTYKTIPYAVCGFEIKGDVKDLALIKTLKDSLVIAAVNNDSARVFKINKH